MKGGLAGEVESQEGLVLMRRITAFVCAYTSKSHMVKIPFLSKKSLVQQMRPSQKTPTGHNAEITGLWDMQLPQTHLHTYSLHLVNVSYIYG